MKWSILILTQPRRADFLKRLLDMLLPQTSPHPDIEVTCTMFNRDLSLGENRARMMDAARGEYLNFIDDDDLVAEDYVESIYPLLDGVDYIGFQLQFYYDGEAKGPTFHSLKYTHWAESNGEAYRNISHLNPMRRELAIRARMNGSTGEDSRWADDMTALGIVKTEHYIPKIMYHYYYRPAKTDGADHENLPQSVPQSVPTNAR